MKPIVALSLLLLAVALGVVLCTQDAESQDTPVSSFDEQLNDLLVKRRDTMRKLLDVVTLLYQEGSSDFNKVVSAQSGLLDAKLQLATKKEERIQIYVQQVEVSRSLERLLMQQHASGEASVEQVLASTAAKLQAEIDLLKEQGKSK